MKYSVPINRENLKEIDGVIYFFHRLEEMLFDYTVDLYKMPLLNTYRLIKEFCDVHKRMANGEVKEYQLNVVFDELIESLKSDIVLKECWGQEKVDRIVGSFGSSSNQAKCDTIKYLNSLFGNGKYYNWCVQVINKYVAQPKKKQKIEAALRCFLPELISQGYNPNFVYNTLKKTLSREVIVESSASNFIKIFDFKREKYRVYFCVSSIAKKYEEILKFYTAIDPSSQIALDVEIGKGSVVLANACINTSANIGEHCIINTASIVEHDNIIENYVHISPNATLSGTVEIGEMTHIGSGAIVKNNIKICNNCTIGAGAVVVKNIDESGVYAGVPVKRLK